jgi:sporulation protein YlmC with PRC-barrel domain
MATRLSDMNGLEIISDSGRKIGSAEDFIIDTEKGEVVKILLSPMGRLSGQELREFLATKSINYSRVRSVTDVIVIADSR